MKTTSTLLHCSAAGALFAAGLYAQGLNDKPGDWPNYGRDAGGTKYSPLNQITPSNVGKLAVAWIYHTGDPAGTWEETPLVIDHVMYFASQKNRTIALDADTGKELWS